MWVENACFAIGKSSDPHDGIEVEDTLCRIGWSVENSSALIESTIIMVWIWIVVLNLCVSWGIWISRSWLASRLQEIMQLTPQKGRRKGVPEMPNATRKHCRNHRDGAAHLIWWHCLCNPLHVVAKYLSVSSARYSICWCMYVLFLFWLPAIRPRKLQLLGSYNLLRSIQDGCHGTKACMIQWRPHEAGAIEKLTGRGWKTSQRQPGVARLPWQLSFQWDSRWREKRWEIGSKFWMIFGCSLFSHWNGNTHGISHNQYLLASALSFLNFLLILVDHCQVSHDFMTHMVLLCWKTLPAHVTTLLKSVST